MSNARKNSKRAHHAKKPKGVQVCRQCGEVHLPHRLCVACGFYGSKQVIARDGQGAQ